ncbi:MAG: response regulator transcription factor [Acidobacteria bacterium]|nr:response regulator transcription factor [Acidobacteriota bacterium]
MAHTTILIVEDEAKVAEAVRAGLEAESYAVTVVKTGEEALSAAATSQFDLVLLDLLLPGCGGLDVLSVLRKRGASTPVLVLTALDAVEDRVEGLEAGADDYLTKPFAFAELLARIRALLRRGRPDAGSHLRLADLEMDRLTRTVTRGGQTIDLTQREFNLLEYLFRHQQSLVSREMIARDMWKERDRATPLDNVIDVHIARLRKKIDQDFPTRLIHTVRGVGFVLREEAP